MWDTWWCNIYEKYQDFSVPFCVICSFVIVSHVTLKGNSFIQYLYFSSDSLGTIYWHHCQKIRYRVVQGIMFIFTVENVQLKYVTVTTTITTTIWYEDYKLKCNKRLGKEKTIQCAPSRSTSPSSIWSVYLRLCFSVLMNGALETDVVW